MIFKTNKNGLADYLRSHPHQEGIIVSRKKKLIYMKPCKTAGTSILRHFLENKINDIFHKKDQPELFDKWINSISDEVLEKYFIFTVIRNPYDRFVSAAKYLNIDCKDLLQNYQQKIQEERVRIHTLPLHYYTHHNGELFVDFICRLKSLQADMNLVCDYLNIERQILPWTNVSRRTKYQDYYDEESKNLAYDLFEDDFLYYGYTFNQSVRTSNVNNIFKKIISKLKFV